MKKLFNFRKCSNKVCVLELAQTTSFCIRDAFKKKLHMEGHGPNLILPPSPPSKVGTKIEGTFFRF